MVTISQHMKESLNIMARENAMAIAFLIHLALAGFLYIVINDMLVHHTYSDIYILLSFSILIIAGSVSIFIMVFVGSFVDTYTRKKRRTLRGHLSRVVARTPYAIVAFLFLWIFSFGAPLLFMFAVKDVFDPVCLFSFLYYFVIWVALAKTFFSPYLVMLGDNIGASLRESWKNTSQVTIELSAITGMLGSVAYASFVMAIFEDTEVYVDIVLLISSSLIMVYLYILIGHMAMSQRYVPQKPGQSTAYRYGQMPYAPPTVLIVGFTVEEVYAIRRSGVPATSLAEWARNASLYDISSRPTVYEGDSTWSQSRIVIFSGVPEADRSLLISRIRNSVGPNVVFTTITPVNSSYTLDSFLANFIGVPPSSSGDKDAEKESGEDEGEGES